MKSYIGWFDFEREQMDKAARKAKYRKDKHFKIKFLYCLLFGYWQKGMGLTNIVKYFLFITGLASGGNYMWQICLIGAMYLLSCTVVGRYYYKWGFSEAESEVGNLFNMLSVELRKYMNKRKL